MSEVEPFYRSLPCWKTSTLGLLDFDQLPTKARRYIAAAEAEVGAAVSIVSTGPRRQETVLRPQPELRKLTSGRLDSLIEQLVSE